MNELGAGFRIVAAFNPGFRESRIFRRAAIENANDIIYTLTPDGIFTYVSPKFTESLGYDTSDAIGKPVQSFIHPDDLPACRELVRLMSAEEEKRSRIEYRVRHKNGSWQWHTTTAASIRDDGGAIVSLLGVCRDITGSRLAEKPSRKARKSTGQKPGVR